MAEEERIVPMRLQKFLARAGVASRRGSEDLMTAGRVTVNGQVVCELGSRVDPIVDEVAVDGKVVQLGNGPVTLMLHKPVDFLTTMDDPQGRPCVAALVPANEYPGLFPIGRLDKDTTGLLLFSTDGELGHALLRPRGHVVKQYFALVEGCPDAEELQALREGIMLDDGLTLPAEIELLDNEAASQARFYLDETPTEPHTARERRSAAISRCSVSVVRVGLHEGRKRQVRRMFAAIGHPVLALHRQAFGPLALDALPRGEWRMLCSEELAALYRCVGLEK